MGVAVVIPAYNAASFITAALASVAGQTFPPSEVVVVDDGSSDKTAELAASWMGRLPLQVLDQSNQGPAAARRVGLAATSAPLVALLDADDFWFPNHLETLVAAHQAEGGIVSANAVRWRPGSADRLMTHAERLPVPPRGAQPLAILRANFVFVSSLFARADYGRVPGFRDGWSGAEDWDLSIQLIRSGVEVTGLAEPTCLYRLVGGGLPAGPEIYERYAAVLRQARLETADAAATAVIDGGIRRYEARSHLLRALQAGDARDPRIARREAREALAGPWAVAAQAAAVMIAPGTASALRGALTRRRWG